MTPPLPRNGPPWRKAEEDPAHLKKTERSEPSLLTSSLLASKSSATSSLPTSSTDFCWLITPARAACRRFRRPGILPPLPLLASLRAAWLTSSELWMPDPTAAWRGSGTIGCNSYVAREGMRSQASRGVGLLLPTTLFPSNPSFSPRGPRCYHSPDATPSCSNQVRPLRRTQCRVNVTTSTANTETSKSVYVKRSLTTSLPTLSPRSSCEETPHRLQGDRLTRPHFPRCRLPTCCRTAAPKVNALRTCRNRLAGSSTGSDAARLCSSSASPKPSACSSTSVSSASDESTTRGVQNIDDPDPLQTPGSEPPQLSSLLLL